MKVVSELSRPIVIGQFGLVDQAAQGFPGVKARAMPFAPDQTHGVVAHPFHPFELDAGADGARVQDAFAAPFVSATGAGAVRPNVPVWEPIDTVVWPGQFKHLFGLEGLDICRRFHSAHGWGRPFGGFQFRSLLYWNGVQNVRFLMKRNSNIRESKLPSGLQKWLDFSGDFHSIALHVDFKVKTQASAINVGRAEKNPDIIHHHELGMVKRRRHQKNLTSRVQSVVEEGWHGPVHDPEIAFLRYENVDSHPSQGRNLKRREQRIVRDKVRRDN